MKRTRLNKREVETIGRIADRLNKLMRRYDEENDIPLRIDGNGTVGENISCACAALETILQEYD